MLNKHSLDLSRLTLSDHPDTSDIKKSLESISSLVSLINEKKRSEEGATGLFEAYESTRNCPPTLISSTRSLIHATEALDACCGKACKLYLCSDLLMIAYKCNKHVMALSKDKTIYSYKFDKWVDLNEMKLKNVDKG